jgi:hypothetical protein
VPLTVETSSPPTPPGLTLVGRAYRFAAEWEPVMRNMRVEITPPKGVPTDRLGVYLYDRGTWWPLGPTRGATTPLFGTFALLRDDEPPQFGEAVVGDDGGAPSAKIVVWDRGCGLSHAGISLTLDGVAQTFRYTPLKSEILWSAATPLPRGAHRLIARVCDHMGNCAEKQVAIDGATR